MNENVKSNRQGDNIKETITETCRNQKTGQIMRQINGLI